MTAFFALTPNGHRAPRDFGAVGSVGDFKRMIGTPGVERTAAAAAALIVSGWLRR